MMRIGTHTRTLLLSLLLTLGVMFGGCDDDPKTATTDTGDTQTATDTDVQETQTDTSDDVALDVPSDQIADQIADQVADQVEETTDLGELETDAADVVVPVELQEVEPNNGATLTEFNDLPIAAIMSGAIDTAGDVDIFKFDAVPGRVYVAVLAPTPGSPFQPHLTAMDGGRGTKAPGDDYVKMAASPSVPVTVELLAMGEGGYLLIVRDLRALSSNPVGGAAYTYQVMVAAQDPQFFQGQALTLANDQIDDSLSSPGAVKLYPFSATEGQNLKADLTAVSELDGRLFVYSVATGDWIARNDDRSAGDRNPLLDAPLFASGEMFLVVENIDETATALGYHLAVTSP